jgi:hypothetical protein
VDTIRLVLEAAWKILIFGLLLGAGLPALFALGVRMLAGAEAVVGADGATTNPGPSVLSKALAAVCFAVVLFGVVSGIMVIVGAGLGKVVSFDHVIPTLVPKP